MASTRVVRALCHVAVFVLFSTANYHDFVRGYSRNLSFKSGEGAGRKGASYAGQWKYLSILLSEVEYSTRVSPALGTYKKFGGRFPYLSNLNMVAQTVFFASCVVMDVLEAVLGRKPSTLKMAQDYLLAVLLFPMAMMVQCLFWALYAVDRELVYPSKLDGVIPTWMNHVWHTSVVPVLLLDMYVVHRNYPARKAGLPGTFFFGALYLIWIRIVAHYGGFWVYPFLEIMGPIETTIFNLTTITVLCGFYLIGEYVNAKLSDGDAEFEISSTTRRKQSKKSA